MVRRTLVRLLRLRVWFADRLRPREVQITLFWAGFVGLTGGLSSIAFKEGLEAIQWWLTGSGGTLEHAAAGLPPLQRLLVPAVGALVAGLVIVLGARLAKGLKSTDYMEAIVLGDGAIRSRPTLARSSAALIAIGSGASIGREGPMVQLAAWIASWSARRAPFATPRRRLIVACGAAAGIASAYNAPIAGAMFVAEIVLGTIAMETFGPLVFSSVVATLVTREISGTHPVYDIPRFHHESAFEIVPFLFLGLGCGVAGVLFLRLLRTGTRFFAFTRLPLPLRLCLGGLVVGAVSLHRPGVWGNGFGVVSSILQTDWVPSALAWMLVCKVVATTASFGSGTPGGVFTPTLFVGAVVGALFGSWVGDLCPFETARPQAYAVVGMGGLLAATTQAPLMAILMLFEMTLDYEIMLPLMLVCVTAHTTAAGLERVPVYEHKVRSPTLTPSGGVGALRIEALVRPNPPAVRAGARFDEIAKLFLKQRHDCLYVVDNRDRYLGAITLHDVKSSLSDQQLAAVVTAHDLADPSFPCVSHEASVVDALHAFRNPDLDYLPVIFASDQPELIGTVSKTDLLMALAQGSESVAPRKASAPERS